MSGWVGLVRGVRRWVCGAVGCAAAGVLLVGTAGVPVAAQNAVKSVAGRVPRRPAITGIAFVRFAVSDPAGESRFLHEMGYRAAGLGAGADGVTDYRVNGTQHIETVPGGPVETAGGPNRLLVVGLQTSSVPAMRAYLEAKGVAVDPGATPHLFEVKDPEGNTIAFTDAAAERVPAEPGAIAHRIIHAGFVVQSAEREDAFYRDVLGFHPYWHGGMQDDVTDWSSLQVPDGTDWVEYMLRTKPGTGAAQRGVSNHVSLGVVKMDAAVAQLKANGCDTKECAAAQMGRDGKVQLNLYDPDHTRVEVMEFRPTGPVCCSAYTGRMPEGAR